MSHSHCLLSSPAVRLGRCPKKDRPSSNSFFVLPQSASGAVDIDKQVKTEQMVLAIHDAFKAAVLDYDAIAKQLSPEEVCFSVLSAFSSSDVLHLGPTTH